MICSNPPISLQIQSKAKRNEKFIDSFIIIRITIFIFRSCDEFITEQAKSIIYASYRIDVPELAKVRDQLIFKFGQQIVPDQEVGVYPRLVLKLSMSNPDRYFCEQYIEAIAASFGIDWEGNSSIGSESSSLPDLLDSSNEKEELFPHHSDPRPHIPASLSSYSHTSSLKNSASSEVDPEKSAVDHLSPPPYNALSKGSSAPLPMDYSKQQPARPVITTTAPVITPATTAVKTQKPPTTTTSSNIPDFDELTRRFEALRKK